MWTRRSVCEGLKTGPRTDRPARAPTDMVPHPPTHTTGPRTAVFQLTGMGGEREGAKASSARVSLPFRIPPQHLNQSYTTGTHTAMSRLLV